MKTRKNYEKPFAVAEHFLANSYCENCKLKPAIIEGGGQTISLPSNTHFIMDGYVGHVKNDSYKNGQLDWAEYNGSATTTNSSSHITEYDYKITAWIKENIPSNLTESDFPYNTYNYNGGGLGGSNMGYAKIELGVKQDNKLQFDAYTVGTLVPQNRS